MEGWVAGVRTGKGRERSRFRDKMGLCLLVGFFMVVVEEYNGSVGRGGESFGGVGGAWMGG